MVGITLESGRSIEDVEKGLEVCASVEYCHNADCPYQCDDNCIYSLPKDALESIRKLKKLLSGAEKA